MLSPYFQCYLYKIRIIMDILFLLLKGLIMLPVVWLLMLS